MDKAVAILVLVVVGALLIAGHLYMKLDRQRSLALVYLKKMSGGLERWLSVTDEAFSLPAVDEPSRQQYTALREQYRGLSKKQAAQRVPVVNEIYALANAVIAENVSNPELNALGVRLSDEYYEFLGLQEEYNVCVKRLDSLLDNGITAAVGKAIRLQPMERLSDLNVL